MPLYVLKLNDMRWPKFEMSNAIAKSENRDDLVEFLERERVELYKEEVEGRRWAKSFRKGGPLEWFNPPTAPDYSGSNSMHGIVEYMSLDDVLRHTREEYEAVLAAIPDVSEISR